MSAFTIPSIDMLIFKFFFFFFTTPADEQKHYDAVVIQQRILVSEPNRPGQNFFFFLKFDQGSKVKILRMGLKKFS
jgi:hypothetical protein